MSDTDFSVTLPDPLPDDEITVDREEITYITYENSDGETIPKNEYTLDKAPINRINTVRGVTNGNNVTFTKGGDYTLTEDRERIKWLDNRRPDSDSTFYVTYDCESILSRFNESVEDELDEQQHILNEIVDSKLITQAEGDELDKIGKLFGDFGDRRGKSDDQYRLYLKSVVKSVISRGTVPDIKSGIAAATGLDPEDITIDEDFVNVEYSIIINPSSSLRGSTVEDIAQLAAPSGVKQSGTRFSIGPDEVVVDDSYEIPPPVAETADTAYSDDSLAFFGFGSEGKTSDTLVSDDTTVVDGNVTTTTDTAYANDTTTTSITMVSWDDNNWNEFNWQ